MIVVVKKYSTTSSKCDSSSASFESFALTQAFFFPESLFFPFKLHDDHPPNAREVKQWSDPCVLFLDRVCITDIMHHLTFALFRVQCRD